MAHLPCPRSVQVDGLVLHIEDFSQFILQESFIVSPQYHTVISSSWSVAPKREARFQENHISKRSNLKLGRAPSSTSGNSTRLEHISI